MKKLLFVLAALSLCFVGCGSDDDENGENNGGDQKQNKSVKYDATCKAMFITPVLDCYGNSLSDDQKKQFNDNVLNSCYNFFDNVPICKNELFEYYKCIHVDYPEDLIILNKEEKDIKGLKCQSSYGALNACSNANKEKWESGSSYFDDENINPSGVASKLFTDWNVEDNECGTEDESASIDYKAICESMYIRDYVADNEIDKLETTDEQKTQLKEKYVSVCSSSYSALSVCTSEAYEYYKCIYVDNTADYFEGEKEKEYKCEEDFGDREDSPEAKACIDALFQACKAADSAMDSCSKTNEAAINSFTESFISPDAEANKLLKSWGFEIKEEE